MNMVEISALQTCCNARLPCCCKKSRHSGRQGLITVSFVDVSPDLRNASIYFTCLKPTCSEEALADLLNERAGHFRRLLGQALPLRAVPQLLFRFDHSLNRANRLTELIERANQKPSE